MWQKNPANSTELRCQPESDSADPHPPLPLPETSLRLPLQAVSFGRHDHSLSQARISIKPWIGIKISFQIYDRSERPGAPSIFPKWNSDHEAKMEGLDRRSAGCSFTNTLAKMASRKVDAIAQANWRQSAMSRHSCQ